MSLMSALYVGKSGLQTSQNSLNTTAHNLSNLDTSGYTRQQVATTDVDYSNLSININRSSYLQTGLGVVYSETRQVRDVFLDQTYRRESGRSSFYNTSYETMTEIESVLGELYGTSFSDSISSLQTSLQELQKTPSDTVVQGLFVQNIAAFIDNSKAVYQGLCDYQDNLNLQIKQSVETINKYANQISELNKQILRVEAAEVENANDMRDQRNLLLDELASLANISYSTDVWGNVVVSMEGHLLVSKDMVHEIGLAEDITTGFYTPYWADDATYKRNADGTYMLDASGKKILLQDSEGNTIGHLGAEVFDLTRTISSATNTDIGLLKGQILARGDHRANYTDLEDTDTYNKEIAQSIIMNVQAEFDRLVHAVVTELNDIILNAADTSSGYLCDQDGNIIQLFELQSVSIKGDTNYPITTTDADGNTVLTWDPDYAGVDTNVKDDYRYTVSNLVINQYLLQNPTALGFVLPDNSEDRESTTAMANLFNNKNLTLNPNLTTKLGYNSYYSALVAQVANSGAVFKSICETQDATVQATESKRDQVIGVSSDEELNNMIKYQNAYNASSRYINVISEMLEHIISTLGA